MLYPLSYGGSALFYEVDDLLIAERSAKMNKTKNIAYQNHTV